MKKLGFFLVFFAVLCGAAFAQNYSATGTGFFVNGDGVIVTCAHVIDGGRRVMVVIDGEEKLAEVVARDDENDLAVLKVDYRNPYHFKVGNFSALSLGDELQILGFPLTNYTTDDIRFTQGTLSARSGLKDSVESAFQHSAPTQPGNSGGPIFNERLEVVGVASAVMNDKVIWEEVGLIPQNMNFGVKSEYIFPLLDQFTPGPGTLNSVSDAEKATVLIRVYNNEAPAQGIMITVANSTGYTGRFLYVSPRSSDTWGPERLGERYLYSGDSVSLPDVPASEGNRYDLRLVDSDDDSYTMWDVVIRPNQTVEFTFNDFDNVDDDDSDDYPEEDPEPPSEGPSISIVNNTGKTIYYLYVSPSSSDNWGEDWLGSDVLSRGDSVSVRLPHPLRETDRYDFRAEDADGNSYSKFRVTVTANARITFTANDSDGNDRETLPTITVTNNTGFTFYYLYVSPSSSDSWGNDVLGSDVLSSGGSTTIELPHPISHTSRYNIMAKDSDGDTYTKYNVTVSANGRVTFTFDDYDGGSLPSITITNNTGYTFYYLYVSPSSSDSWGEDVLGSEVLSNGRSVTVQLPEPLSRTDRYDFSAEDADGDTYTKFNVRVSANGRVTFVLSDID